MPEHQEMTKWDAGIKVGCGWVASGYERLLANKGISRAFSAKYGFKGSHFCTKYFPGGENDLKMWKRPLPKFHDV
ncbi:hypothetical protein V3F56_10135 [Moorellaceae bacterium AZ2]